MTYKDFSVEFNNVVENIHTISREYRHTTDPQLIDSTPVKELNKFNKFLDDVNFKMDFKDDPEEYVYSKMLDAMDYLLDNWISKKTFIYRHTDTFKTFNSIYDCIKEFYFNK